MSGLLIAFEGLDQSGKETQAQRLRVGFEAAGDRVETLEFPDYHTFIAREIAEALHGRREYGPDVLQLLYVANRYEYRTRIADWLTDGRVVLCDRYLASSIAYGEAQGLDAAWLADVQRYLPQPDLTVLLDIAPETALARKATGRDRFERDLALLARVRKSYVRQASAPAWAVVDGERPRDDVTASVGAIVSARFGRP